MPDQSTASTGTDDQDNLDHLFDAIRDQDPEKVRKILGEKPDLVNRFNGDRLETPQQLFDNKRFEYILTQDILRRRTGDESHDDEDHENESQDDESRDDEIIVTELCRQSPLHLACILGDMDTVKALLQQEDIHLELQNDSEETSFSLACRSANLHTAHLLLERGFKLSPKMMDNANNHPLDYLVYRGIYPVWPENPPGKDFLVLSKLTRKILDIQKFDEGHIDQLLRSVVLEGNLPMFEAVVKGFWGKINLDTKYEDDWTLLHLAAMGGHKEVVEKLLEEGANPNSRTKTPDRMDAGEIAMEFLSDLDTAQAIATKILVAQLMEEFKQERTQSNPESNESGVEHSRSKCWRWLSHDRHLQHEKDQRQVNPSTIEKLIEQYGRKDKPPTQGETMWCHLQANSVSIFSASLCPHFEERPTA